MSRAPRAAFRTAWRGLSRFGRPVATERWARSGKTAWIETCVALGMMVTQSVTLVGPTPVAGSERGRLDATLRQVSELSQGWQAGRLGADPRPLLSQLRVDWELHFALEEADAYFGVVIRERPSLSHVIVALKREHELLLGQLETLRGQAADTEHWATLAVPVAELVESFRGHEHREADLLQEFFLRDDGTGAD